MPLPEDENEWKKLLVIFVTANGNVRKNTLEDFSNINASGKIAMKLEMKMIKLLVLKFVEMIKI